ncbi:MAG: enoyl-CoA hydratase/isomerase family protein, partial [Acidobacteria bacterium]|nr:enoyl-CoA hydratase/isomerase family protein [Acidobacteriota bacterium]
MAMIRTEVGHDGIAVVTLDHPAKSVNTLSPALIEEFEETVSPLLEDERVRAMVLTSAKKDTFIAGADLEVLDTMTNAKQPEALSRQGNALLSGLACSPKPVVAAVHGAALGGGLEVALACHYILASDDPATVLSQAEVMVGLNPAGGGSQRLIERVGLVAGLPLLLTGRRVRARHALRMGLVDALTTPGGITATAVRAAAMLAEGSLSRPRRRRTLLDRVASTAPGRALVLRAARKQLARRSRGLYPAPAAILDCVETGLKGGIQAGLERESEHFGRLVMSNESRALRWLFFAMRALARPTASVPPRPVERLAVLGGGLMGSGIASVSLGVCPVVVRDINDDALATTAKAVDDGLLKQVRSGAIRRIDRDRRSSRLYLTLELDDLEGADLVVEAVFEDLGLKRRLLAETESRVSAETVLASNTSALPISAIAAGAAHPERVLGMHYFSPVPKMPLLEIIVTEATAPWAAATAHTFGAAQGKTCIIVKDGPGFYTTRILAPYLNEAVVLLQEGADTRTVDEAVKDFGYPVGPLALIDEVGIDVGAHVADQLGRAFADRGLEGTDVLPRMVAA